MDILFLIIPLALLFLYALLISGVGQGTPIYSKYTGFNTRKIIYEYRGGRRVVRSVSKAYGGPFPIPTSIASNDNKLFNEILNNNISESSKISLAIDYKVCGYGDTRLIGSRFMHLISNL